MPCDSGYLHNVEPVLEKSSGCLVAQVMKVKVVNARITHGANECLLDSLGGNSWKYISSVVSRKRC